MSLVLSLPSITGRDYASCVVNLLAARDRIKYH